jgi:HlyD family secretion protein
MPVKKKSIVMKLIIVILVLALLGAGGYLAYQKQGSLKKSDDNKTPLYTVQSGHLLISVTSSGTIKAQDQVILKSEIEGRTTILSIVPEATRAKKGDLLVELDATSLKDRLIKQEIVVDNSHASFIKAQGDLGVGKNQAQSDIEKAELTLQFAKQDLEKYTKGEYPNKYKEAENKITINELEKTRAQDKYDASLKLAKGEYISQLELKTDELSLSKAELATELAKSDLKLLEDYTYKRQIDQLQSNVKQADMALERARLKAKANVVQFEARLKASDSVLKREISIQEKLQQQISKAKIYAPSDGMVVYASSTKANWHRSEEPLDVGQDVREYEELIHLPTADSVKSVISIHETNLTKVEEGMIAEITVDTQRDKVYYGRVNKIAVLPDAMMVFINPDLKVYPTDVYIEGDTSELRTGMSCRTEIIVAEYDNVKYVPVQAVVKVGDQATVYVMNKGKMTPRPVEIGLDNNRMIHIISGLEVGEQIVLTPPLAEGEVSRTNGKRNGDKRPARKMPAGDAVKSDKPAKSQAEKKTADKPKDMAAMMTDQFNAMDKNGDGKIDIKAEVSDQARQFITMADSNGDGFVSKSEMSSVAKSMPGGKR